MDRKQARENRGDENYDRKQFYLFMFGKKNFLGKRIADPHLKSLPLTFNQG